MSVATYDRKKSKVKEENLAEFIMVGDLSIKKPLHKTDHHTRSCKLRWKNSEITLVYIYKRKYIYIYICIYV